MSKIDDLRAIGITNNHNYNRNSNTGKNNVASIIKVLAIVTGIIGGMFGFTSIDKSDFAIPIVVASIISAVFIYSLGEIIQLLQDIKNK